MNDDDLVEVYVYPDGDVHEEPVDYKSDDYIIRKTRDCIICGELIKPVYGSPIGFCDCGERVCLE